MNTTIVLTPPFFLKNHFVLKLKIKTVFGVFWTMGIVSITALVVFCVFQVNAEFSEKYKTLQYEKKLSEISKENKNLENGLLQINSLNNIADLIAGLGLQESNKIHYIKVLDTQVVTK